MKVVPITIREACEFVRRLHRHHRPPQGGLFALAAAKDGVIVGVAIVGRPVARMASDGYTAEVTRVCTDGTRNACSFLYARCWRAVQALGYTRLITYTLEEEGGASLRGAGWRVVGESRGGNWQRQDRPRVDDHPTQGKIKWEA